MLTNVKVDYELNGAKRTKDGDLAYIAVGRHLDDGVVKVDGVVYGHICDPAVMGIVEGLRQAVGSWTIIRCLVRKAIRRLFGLEGQA